MGKIINGNVLASYSVREMETALGRCDKELTPILLTSVMFTKLFHK